jgi:hypothetical protein
MRSSRYLTSSVIVILIKTYFILFSMFICNKYINSWNQFVDSLLD